MPPRKGAAPPFISGAGRREELIKLLEQCDSNWVLDFPPQETIVHDLLHNFEFYEIKLTDTTNKEIYISYTTN